MNPIQRPIKLIECPRDAMQGIHDFIPTDKKVAYINQILKVGFDTVDFGSFVSPKAIPQMEDTAAVLSQLLPSPTDLLAIVANTRGAQDACKHSRIKYLGYPFSISETFQIRNTNSSIADSLKKVKNIKHLCDENNKELVIYISMGFGNPYGDPWNTDICEYWVDAISNVGVKIINLSDTIGVATPESIQYLFSTLIPRFTDVEFGAHLHTKPGEWKEKILAAYESGCTRYDGAIKGYGGCPMAKDDLTGNMPMENLIYFFEDLGLIESLDVKAFLRAMGIATETFPQ